VSARGPLAKARALLALGIRNLARVGSYRAQLRFGVHRAQRLRERPMPTGPFFSRTPAPPVAVEGAELTYFGWHRVRLEHGTAWHTNPFTGRSVLDPRRPWWMIPDFDPDIGDIKTIWEASRLDWAVDLASRADHDPTAATRLETWLRDWSASNPAYRGPNWKCGQEASLRVLHLATAALLLDTVHETTASLRDLVALHLERIDPTMSYAVGQDNNHGTSEAAALFVGGSWLDASGDARGRAWMATGRQWLEERARRLIETDGTFSQYSVTYHRLMLDTYSLAEVWRRTLALPPFSAPVIARLDAATRWLYTITDAESGDAPNIGGNDGAHLLQIGGVAYRDFRPSVQLAMALFGDRAAYAVPDADVYLGAFGIERPLVAADAPRSRLFDDGGYAVLRCDDALAVLRYPRFRFRPAHADPLHVDLFVHGENVLRDGGTYSYNAGEEWLSYFAGIRSHNTIQFDDREPMRRLGRFLWGDWLRTEEIQATVDGASPAVAAAYRDRAGARHSRSVTLTPGVLRVEDRISGARERAVLRWRLRPGEWRLDGDTVSDGRDALRVTVHHGSVRCVLVAGWESRYYMQKTSLPVLEVEILGGGDRVISSEYHWPTP